MITIADTGERVPF